MLEAPKKKKEQQKNRKGHSWVPPHSTTLMDDFLCRYVMEFRVSPALAGRVSGLCAHTRIWEDGDSACRLLGHYSGDLHRYQQRGGRRGLGVSTCTVCHYRVHLYKTSENISSLASCIVSEYDPCCKRCFVSYPRQLFVHFFFYNFWMNPRRYTVRVGMDYCLTPTEQSHY